MIEKKFKYKLKYFLLINTILSLYVSKGKIKNLLLIKNKTRDFFFNGLFSINFIHYGIKKLWRELSKILILLNGTSLNAIILNVMQYFLLTRRNRRVNSVTFVRIAVQKQQHLMLCNAQAVKQY